MVVQVQIRPLLVWGEYVLEKFLKVRIFLHLFRKGVTQDVCVWVKLGVWVTGQDHVPFFLGEAFEECSSVVDPGRLLCSFLLLWKAVFVTVKGWSNLIGPPLSVLYTIFPSFGFLDNAAS